ncbi:hypothetical protein B0T18DRAFT_247888 [Schizothecium vesticola]|uniref:Uncharacterized protein n=1 Tax=Schizothecium vesticola TaxID=314040 RepID=A0AA40BQF0_9PEZI|nr:hypothetical protein B0T18DRAFT_247888 [Schizothecium vesticola]
MAAVRAPHSTTTGQLILSPPLCVTPTRIFPLPRYNTLDRIEPTIHFQSITEPPTPHTSHRTGENITPAGNHQGKTHSFPWRLAYRWCAEEGQAAFPSISPIPRR